MEIEVLPTSMPRLSTIGAGTGLREASDGSCVSDEEGVKKLISDHFSTVFGEESSVVQSPNFSRQRILPESARDLLIRPVCKEEVRNALRSMKSYKAPGPDGLQPIFLKSFWDGDAVVAMIQHALSFGEFPLEIAHTLIVLIPKEETPKNISQFRPISLCNVLYKILAKKYLIIRLHIFGSSSSRWTCDSFLCLSGIERTRDANSFSDEGESSRYCFHRGFAPTCCVSRHMR